LIIWKEFGFQYPLIRAARVDAGGTVHPPVTLGETFGRGHSVVWNGSEYLAAWQGPSRVALFRLAAGGEPISSALTLLSFEATNGGSIALAWNGSQYLIAWNDRRNPADGSFTGNNYRLVTADDAIAHDASVAAVIHSRLTDERSTRLYVSIDSGRLRSARH